MPLCHRRVAAGPRLRVARGTDRTALSPARAAGDRVQLQWRAANIVRHLSHGPATVTASSRISDTPETGLRRIAANLTICLALLVRPRLFKESRLLPPYIRLAAGSLA